MPTSKKAAVALSLAAVCGTIAYFSIPSTTNSNSVESLPPLSSSLPLSSTTTQLEQSPLRHRRLSTSLPDGGCEISWPQKPPAGVQITYAASYPGCGARMTWNLVEALTGLWTGDDWNNNGRGEDVVTVKTHYPQSNGILVDFDEKIQRGFIVIRNPLKSIPSFFNHIYEMRNHLPVHSERAPIEEWVKWRNAYLDSEIAEYKKFIFYWYDRYTPENRLVITYEGLTDDLIGPEVTKGLNEFLGRADGVTTIDQSSVACIWRAVVKNEAPAQQAAQFARLQSMALNQPQGTTVVQPGMASTQPQGAELAQPGVALNPAQGTDEQQQDQLEQPSSNKDVLEQTLQSIQQQPSTQEYGALGQQQQLPQEGAADQQQQLLQEGAADQQLQPPGGGDAQQQMMMMQQQMMSQQQVQGTEQMQNIEGGSIMNPSLQAPMNPSLQAPMDPQQAPLDPALQQQLLEAQQQLMQLQMMQSQSQQQQQPPPPGLRRRLDPGHHNSQRAGPQVPRPYTAEQLDKIMNMLLEVATKYHEEDVRLYHIMMGYYENIRGERAKLSSDPLSMAPPGGFY